MRALVTGGTGFVGAWLARTLHEAGHSVRVLHRPSSKLTALEGVPFASALGDVTEAEALHAACTGMDWVFHVAAVADYWRADQTHMMHVNVEGTRRVLEAARAAGVRRVVFTSSAAAVGFFDERPSDERDAFNLPPERFPYGYSKHLAEGVVGEAVQQGQDVVTVNPVVIMGPGDLNLISGSFVLQMARFGRLTPSTSGGISVIDVRDVARMHLAAAERGTSGERYILMAANYRYDDWFALIAEALNMPPPRIRLPDFVLEPAARLIELGRKLGLPTPIDANQTRLGKRKVYFDGAKAHAALGAPQVSMADCLHDTVAWYRRHGFLK